MQTTNQETHTLRRKSNTDRRQTPGSNPHRQEHDTWGREGRAPAPAVRNPDRWGPDGRGPGVTLSSVLFLFHFSSFSFSAPHLVIIINRCHAAFRTTPNLNHSPIPAQQCVHLLRNDPQCELPVCRSPLLRKELPEQMEETREA